MYFIYFSQMHGILPALGTGTKEKSPTSEVNATAVGLEIFTVHSVSSTMHSCGPASAEKGKKCFSLCSFLTWRSGLQTEEDHTARWCFSSASLLPWVIQQCQSTSSCRVTQGWLGGDQVVLCAGGCVHELRDSWQSTACSLETYSWLWNIWLLNRSQLGLATTLPPRKCGEMLSIE